MSKYIVEIPIAGSISIEVDADDADTAIERAWNHYSEKGADDFDIEWDAFESIASGNVCHAPTNSVSASKTRS